MDIVAADPGPTETGCPQHREALAAFGNYALGEPEVDDLLDEASRTIAGAMGAPFCRVMQYRPDDGDLYLRSGSGWPPGVVGRVRVPADQTNPIGKALISGKPLVTADFRLEPAHTLPSLFADHAIVSSVCIPIIGSEGGFGTLDVDTTSPRTFTAEDVKFLTGFASMIAEAINRVRSRRVLRQTLREKEVLARERGVLLREMQHRVRNHLQLVQASLSVHARRTKDAAARRGFRDVAGHVLALSTLYDHLLGVGMEETIDFSTYLSSLCASMERIGELHGKKIELVCASDHVKLDLDRSTALGIVCNELVSNALEHAFAGTGTSNGAGTGGKVNISLRRTGSGEAVLTVADDGKGLDHQARRGVGMQLVERLVKQVDGVIEVTVVGGTAWKITFPL